MRYIVTGGGGFIGSHIVGALEQLDAGPVTVVDELDSSRWSNLARCKLYALVEPRDIWDYLRACPADITVIHMGARTSTTDKDVAALVSTNVALTVNLFEYCGRRGWPFLYASSASVYGADNRQSDEIEPSQLLARPPLNPYAWSKLQADQMIWQRMREAPSPTMWAGLRLFNVYGRGEQHKLGMRSFVTKCFDAISGGKPIEVFRGSDSFSRDWVYVEDVARLAVAFVTAIRDSIPAGVYNVGAGESHSFVDVARACIEASGRIASLKTVDFPDELRGQYQTHTKADLTKLHAALPSFQFTKLAEGLRHYWGRSPLDEPRAKRA